MYKNNYYLCNPLRKSGYKQQKVLWKDWIDKYKQVPREFKKNLIESVNFLKKLERQEQAKRNKKYTKKSLLLAQDER